MATPEVSTIERALNNVRRWNDDILKNLDSGSNLKRRLENIRELQEQIKDELSKDLQSPEKVLDNIIRKLSQWGIVTKDRLDELSIQEISELLDLMT